MCVKVNELLYILHHSYCENDQKVWTLKQKFTYIENDIMHSDQFNNKLNVLLMYFNGLENLYACNFPDYLLT